MHSDRGPIKVKNISYVKYFYIFIFYKMGKDCFCNKCQKKTRKYKSKQCIYSANADTCICPSGQQYNPFLNTCTCANGRAIYNNTTNTCMCPNITQLYDIGSNTCVCPTGQYLNSNSGVCTTCPSDSNVSGDTCVCNDNAKSYDASLNICV